MVKHPFLSRLSRGPLLADGALGTELYRRGVIPDQVCIANIDQSELVQELHMAYLQAGAELIETNSFGANRIQLARCGRDNQVARINRQAAKLARYARDTAGSQAFIAGSISPLTISSRTTTRYAVEQGRALFSEQIEALIEGGVDLLLFETFPDVEELAFAVKTARELCQLPIIASATFGQDGRTPWGQTPQEVVKALQAAQADVIGLNCSVGPSDALDIAKQMLSAGVEYLSMIPNAGMPQRTSDGRLLYAATPAYFAEIAVKAAAAGVSVIGGCCGTTPEHIAAMRQALDAAHPEKKPAAVTVVLPPRQKAGQDTEPTAWAKKLAAGQFVTSIELSPPRGLHTGAFMRQARQIAEAGCVDAINVTDSPMARVRMDVAAACYMLQTQVQIETIAHVTTRDHSLIGLESMLIGAHAMGVRNILALTGDPPSLGTWDHSSAVYDIDSIGLVEAIQAMKRGQDIVGTDLGYGAGFCVGAAADPTRDDLRTEAERLHRKIEAGAEYVMTQPLFDLALWDRFCAYYGGEVEVPVILGVLPLLSQQHAEYLHNEVPGITLSEAVLEEMRRAGANGQQVGIRLAKEMVAAAHERFAGVYLMPSYNRCETVLQVLE